LEREIVRLHYVSEHPVCSVAVTALVTSTKLG